MATQTYAKTQRAKVLEDTGTVRTVDYFDGDGNLMRVEHIRDDGSLLLRRYPDGREEKFWPGGELMRSDYPDGRTDLCDQEGNLVFISYPDGRREQFTRYDGSVFHRQRPDGRPKVYGPDFEEQRQPNVRMHRTYPDGRVEHVKGTLVRYPGGHVEIIRGAGTVMESWHQDGRMRREHPDGRVDEFWRNEWRMWLKRREYADGRVDHIREDGTLMHREYPDGRVEFYERYETEASWLKDPDGQVSFRGPDGQWKAVGRR